MLINMNSSNLELEQVLIEGCSTLAGDLCEAAPEMQALDSPHPQDSSHCILGSLVTWGQGSPNPCLLLCLRQVWLPTALAVPS